MRICALFLIALAARAQSVNFFSLEQEADLGAKLAGEVLKKSTPTAHENVRAYVERLGRRIASEVLAVPDARGRVFFARFRFAVITGDTPDAHEPLTLPGGYMIVSEHLILAARDEAEFAGMLAHAMAHTAGRHSTRMLTRAYIAEHQAYVPNADAIEVLARNSGSLLPFWRELEREADSIGIGLAAAAGFDPSSFQRYIERQGDTRRAERIARQIVTLPARSYSTSDEFLAIQRELR